MEKQRVEKGEGSFKSKINKSSYEWKANEKKKKRDKERKEKEKEKERI